MKKRIFSVLGILLAFLFILSSCGKTEIEQSQEDYDWDKVYPIVKEITGPTTFVASGLQAANYLATPRGGSTFAWSVDKVNATITPDPDGTYRAAITFEQLDEDSVAFVKVVETTHAGIVSEPTSLKIDLLRFCPLAMDSFTGSYTEADGDGQTAPVTVTRDPNDELLGLVLNGILGEDYWWGPPGGKLVVKIEGCNNYLFFSKQTTGIVDGTYGKVSMELLDGEPGWINTDDFSFGYQGKVTVSAGSFGDYPFVYTKNK